MACPFLAMGACGLPPRARKASRGAGFESKMTIGSSANVCLRADTWHASGLLLGGLGLLLEVAQGARTCHQNAPRKRAQKARPKFSGAERAPRKAKGSRGGTYFFWDNFWDDFWDLFWAVLRGGGLGNLGLQPVVGLFKGRMRRLVRWLQASGAPGGKPLQGSAGCLVNASRASGGLAGTLWANQA